PLYNEAPNVAPLAKEIFTALGSQGQIELILVDDASDDDTWQAILQAQETDPRARGIRHLARGGQSAALWTGFRSAAAPIIATLDGDLQNNPDDLPALLAKL